MLKIQPSNDDIDTYTASESASATGLGQDRLRDVFPKTNTLPWTSVPNYHDLLHFRSSQCCSPGVLLGLMEMVTFDRCKANPDNRLEANEHVGQLRYLTKSEEQANEIVCYACSLI